MGGFDIAPGVPVLNFDTYHQLYNPAIYNSVTNREGYEDDTVYVTNPARTAIAIGGNFVGVADYRQQVAEHIRDIFENEDRRIPGDALRPAALWETFPNAKAL